MSKIKKGIPKPQEKNNSIERPDEHWGPRPPDPKCPPLPKGPPVNPKTIQDDEFGRPITNIRPTPGKDEEIDYH